jgi:hypothetical protein
VNRTPLLHRAAGAPPREAHDSRRRDWEGRLFGGLVLAAFPLYGIGSALADRPIGLALVAANSLAVTVVGIIGWRLVRSRERAAGIGYLVARIVEATLLAAGAAFVYFADEPDTGDTAYRLGMLALGVGSIPFFDALRRRGWLPAPLAVWGMVGYTTLAVGALIDLMTGREVIEIFSIPGGLFELAIGVILLRRGFWALDERSQTH